MIPGLIVSAAKYNRKKKVAKGPQKSEREQISQHKQYQRNDVIYHFNIEKSCQFSFVRSHRIITTCHKHAHITNSYLSASLIHILSWSAMFDCLDYWKFNGWLMIVSTIGQSINKTCSVSRFSFSISVIWLNCFHNPHSIINHVPSCNNRKSGVWIAIVWLVVSRYWSVNQSDKRPEACNVDGRSNWIIQSVCTWFRRNINQSSQIHDTKRRRSIEQSTEQPVQQPFSSS